MSSVKVCSLTHIYFRKAQRIVTYAEVYTNNLP